MRCVPGKIVSGEGDTYSVLLYPNGKNREPDPPTSVTVTQLQIDPNSTIPEGTWALVVETGDGYAMQVPMWL